MYKVIVTSTDGTTVSSRVLLSLVKASEIVDRLEKDPRIEGAMYVPSTIEDVTECDIDKLVDSLYEW